MRWAMVVSLWQLELPSLGEPPQYLATMVAMNDVISDPGHTAVVTGGDVTSIALVTPRRS